MTDSATVVLTDAAAIKVKSLLEQEGRDDLNLRIAVQPGGCSGLRYQLFFDDRNLEGDTVISDAGVGVARSGGRFFFHRPVARLAFERTRAVGARRGGRGRGEVGFQERRRIDAAGVLPVAGEGFGDELRRKIFLRG